MKQIFSFIFLLFLFSVTLQAQTVDTLIIPVDSSLSQALIPDTFVKPVDTIVPVLKQPNLKNKVLNTEAEPVSYVMEFRRYKNKDTLFYVIAGLVLFLAFLKYIYNRYFTNLFKVFFNTSLKQSQLTDQLLQSKLPSLLFNLFFVMSAGLYVYLLLSDHRLIREENWMIALFSVGLIGVIYLLKFCTLKFTGWVTGIAEVTNTYIFVIFLINKIIGIFLVPFIIILAFSNAIIVKNVAFISILCIGLFLLLRFVRSYGLLQNQLKISKFHFMLYIIGIELLPLLLIYKGLMVYFE